MERYNILKRNIRDCYRNRAWGWMAFFIVLVPGAIVVDIFKWVFGGGE